MLKGRGRDPRTLVSPPPATGHFPMRTPAQPQAAPLRPPTLAPQRPALSRPEPDYEVVEFPGEQYVNAKLQPPPPPPPRPPTGHPPDVDASCGLCGGGGARVRCAECGRRALCASCDDMYHRHPKRRHHQRQALSQSQLRDERPPLPPKVAPPVPPPRRHKISGDRMSASPKPPVMDPRRATLSHIGVMMGPHSQSAALSANHIQPQHAHQQIPHHLQVKMTATPTPNHIGSMPFLPTNVHHAAAPVAQSQSNTLGHISGAWNRPRGSLQGFSLHPNMAMPTEAWENSENAVQNWGRPLRRGASVLELGGGGAGVGAGACAGCAHCAPAAWRYGSCASLDHPWAAPWPPACCVQPHAHPHPLTHPPQTPQPYRRAESRAVSRAGSRAGSRAASPAMSIRSRTSRRTKHRTPSPPPLPSSDADSESESESDHNPASKPQDRKEDDSLGPAPSAPTSTWQCEHCTFVNEPGVRVCAVCCRTPTTTVKTIITNVSDKTGRLKITDESRVERGGEKAPTKTKKERTSTGCGPSPPRDANKTKKQINRLDTPTQEEITDRNERPRVRHDMAVGPSPPRDEHNGKQGERNLSTEISLPQDLSRTVRVSPYKDTRVSPKQNSISVGPSPPRENVQINASTSQNNTITNFQKKSAGTSPPRDTFNESRSSLTSNKTNVSNTGTSPPPQSISTQTYEVPSTWERAPSVTRSRPRRRFRDENRRERSHSRHSLSSDTRESDRSVRTSGTGARWEWRERDSSPDNYSRLSRRASHLDLRRTRTNRRSSYYGSEAASPERQSTTRAISLEALAGGGATREAERGMELAQLMSEAERLGFSAAEVQAALTQSPAAPLAWLRERWPSLCAGVRAAAARLAPNAAITELEARAALARHRGAMWPAVTECVERHRRRTDVMGVGEEGRLRGHVWGSPMGAEDDAAPPRSTSRNSHRIREDSSDEFEVPTPRKLQDDDWMYLPLDVNINDAYQSVQNINSPNIEVNDKTEDIANKLKILLQQVGAPLIDEKLLMKGLLSGNMTFNSDTKNSNISTTNKIQPVDLTQSENDFIDAYNALTRSSPLPNINNSTNNDTPVSKKENKAIKKKSKVVSPLEKVKNNILLNAAATESGKENSQSNHQNNTDYNLPQHESKTNTQIIMKQIERHSPNLNTTAFNDQSMLQNENNIVRRPDSNTAYESGNKTEEKAKNLNDIVDNTQKLIQQMKEEINSDINSIDGRTMSHSDPESSSNEEQESSYTDTDDDRTADATTSEEKETTSEDEDKADSENEERPTLIQHRTSSEDNDNFEEALDHVESQLEDFKHANIKMLDSIARSLQEEHSAISEIDMPKIQNISKQDVNNNLFTAVNTFEEIYDQLNNRNRDNERLNLHEQDPNYNSENDNLELLAKQTLSISVFKIAAPSKLIILENAQSVFNATVDNIEEEQSDDNLEKEKASEIDDQINSLVRTENNTKLQHETNDNDRTKNASPTSDTKLVIANSPQTVDSQNELDEYVNLVPEQIQISENIAINIPADIPIDFDITTPTEDEELVIDNKEKEQPNVIYNNTGLDVDQSNGPNNTSPEKSTVSPITDNGNNNKNWSNNKSNIPKLIKTTNNKSKVDKNSPKLIVSKVPVRRVSLKQYPAPAPPKSRFGNIQSGHVKQLQTRLFNDTVTTPKPTPNSTDLVEVKPSTSTLNKKKPAPPPPMKQQEEKHLSPPKILTLSKEKNQYFRETCRTEDEWTDSDSEDSQVQVIKAPEEHKYRPPSPPPPITVRRVSGQIIDLARVQLPEGSPERQARMLLAEGATETWEQAHIAVELITRGADPPAALLAALECADLASALAYLYQDCELCASRFPEHEMVSMLRCTHRCCRECAHHYFTVQINERSIADCVCPYCKLPELENLPEDSWLEYFAHLDILLKTLLEPDVHELFQRKLRDRTLARDPNFRWCMECSSGFFVHPKHKKIRCPECKSVSCASCRKTWSLNHEGLTCDQYTKWLEDNDPERSVTAIQQHLRDNGLECPRCHFKYSLSRGGCMHFTCTQCKYEFCYGCGKTFTMGARCGLSDYCAKLGLHAHHPRNCLFYLRDKEPHELQTLLQMNNVTYETESPEGSTGRCPVQLQRETPTGLVDGTCGSEAPANYAGLCKNHYVEYLSRSIRRHDIDPLPILGVDDLETLVRRAAHRLPPKPYGSLEGLYKRGLIEIVKEKIPLD